MIFSPAICRVPEPFCRVLSRACLLCIPFQRSLAYSSVFCSHSLTRPLAAKQGNSNSIVPSPTPPQSLSSSRCAFASSASFQLSSLFQTPDVTLIFLALLRPCVTYSCVVAVLCFKRLSVQIERFFVRIFMLDIGPCCKHWELRASVVS